MTVLNRKTFTLFWVGTLMIWLLGGMVNVMDVDAAQYAAIALEMVQSGSYLQIFEDGAAYLDKPPLLFWLSAISFKLFGVSALAYKLPSILFALLAVLSVFGFTKAQYNEKTAMLAALILATCQAVFLITNDVRTDTLLTGSVALAIWQFSNYLINSKWKHLIWGSVGVGLAMLAKGPIGLIIPAMALGTHTLIRARWDQIFKWQWLVALAIIALMLLPMCIGLYEQFGTEGLTFYFWTQSFGRITGDNKWSDDSTYFFFTHTFLWAFLPWSIIALPALWKKIRTAITTFGKKNGPELFSLGGVILPFIALSFSQYKLPHYIFVIFPMCSVIVAAYIQRTIEEKKERPIKVLSGIQIGVSIILLCLVALAFIPFGTPSPLLLVALALFLLAATVVIKYGWHLPGTRIILIPIICVLMANLMASGHFYPKLLNFQAAGKAGEYFREHALGPERSFHYNEHRHSLCFEARYIVHNIYSPKGAENLISINGPILIFANEDGKKEFEDYGLTVKVKKEMDDFRVSNLSLPFLTPSTRAQKVQKTYILEVDLDRAKN